MRSPWNAPSTPLSPVRDDGSRSGAGISGVLSGRGDCASPIPGTLSLANVPCPCGTLAGKPLNFRRALG